MPYFTGWFLVIKISIKVRMHMYFCKVLIFKWGVVLLRRIFGPKRDEETGGWRKLRNEELHNLYSSPSIIRIIK
jgi:hypothetical protein